MLQIPQVVVPAQLIPLVIPLMQHHVPIAQTVLIVSIAMGNALTAILDKNHLTLHASPAALEHSHQDLIHVLHVPLLDAQPVTLLVHALIA